MNLELTSDQQMLQETLRRFVNTEVLPQARSWDAEQAMPRAVIAQLAEMGMLGVVVPAEYDGVELGAVELALVVEELARGDGALALTVANHNSLCCAHLALSGSEAQRSANLPALATGEKLGAWALVEPGGDDEVATQAERRGELWQLNGTKVFVTQGTSAELFVILAVTDPEAGKDGISAFLVEKDTAGLTAEPARDLLGMRASDVARLCLTDVQVPESNRLGELGHGYRDAETILDAARITTAALAVGLGSGALVAARDYAKERQQFGQPIAEFQAIQWKLADMATELEAARLLTYRAAWLRDAGQPFARQAAMAKLFAATAAMGATDHAIQIHGGFGYTAEFSPERSYRDARLCSVDKGSDDRQRSAIAHGLLAEA